MFARIRKDHTWEFNTYCENEKLTSTPLFRIVPGYSKEHGNYFDVIDSKGDIVKRKRTWKSRCNWVILEGKNHITRRV